MFWGFVLEPKKRYNTTVTKPFHISMAALDPKSINDDDISSLVLNVDGAETILCNLGKPNYLQERLDLNFIEGNTITLEVKGKATVHLSGYFIYEQDGMEDDSELDDEEDLEDELDDSDIDAKNLKALKKQLQKKNKFNTSTTEEEDSDDDDESGDDDDSIDVSNMTFDDEDDDDDDDDREDDEEEEDDDDEEEEDVAMGSPGSTPMPPPGKKNKQASANSTPVSTNKKKQQQQQESGKKNKGVKQEQQSPQKGLTNGSAPNTPSNKKKKNKGLENGTPNNTPGKQGTSTPGKQGTPTPRKSLEGGVIVEDIKAGSGAPAKSGKMVSVFYVGKLKSNNKQFDSTTSGPGFKFRLGKGEVIKGWDVGLNGMKVGGKRRITIPAHMAYGNKGSPPAIPPNSTLVFDVELKNVN